MKINLIAIGNKMPAWVNEGFQEYIKRFPADCKLHLTEIVAKKRSKNMDAGTIKQQEGQQILDALLPNSYTVALDVKGKLFSTEQLADKLANWKQFQPNVNLIIGGPDGLSSDCLNAAQETWSLSKLTFPHSIVRVILAEQFYRALMILQGHPYHRP